MTCDAHRGQRFDAGACTACGMRFAMLSLGVNLALAVVKVVVGLMSGSRALLASSLYSVNDVLSAVAVAVNLRVATRPPTSRHPYGYGKAEFVAVGMVAAALAVGVFLFLAFSVVELVRGVNEPPHFTALLAAVVGCVGNEALARRGFCAAEKLNSPALHASAEHNRADAISSVAVVVGVAGAMCGLHVLDRFVAAFEAIHVAALSGTLLATSLKGLMDTSLPAEDVDLVQRACCKVAGVRGVAAARSRQAGTQTWVDVAVVLCPDLSVVEAHRLTKDVVVAVGDVLGPSARTQVRFEAERRAPSRRRRRGGQ